MNNLQLATTLVAPTGSGLLYTAYDQGSDIAVWVNGSGSTRSKIELRRTKAKPTPTFAGVERLNFKRTQYETVNGIEYPVIVEFVTSIPVAVTLATRQNAALHAALLARDPVFKDAVEQGVIPT